MHSAKKKPGITVEQREGDARETALTLTELAYLVGAPPSMVEEMLDLELISPCAREPELRFATDALPRARKILRLCTHLGIDLPSMSLVLDLLDRIDEFEKRISELERE